MLDDFGLPPVLLWHINRYSGQSEVQVNFQVTGLDSRLPAEVETAAYRIVQEALTNVARHAGVGAVDVRICYEASSFPWWWRIRGWVSIQRLYGDPAASPACTAASCFWVDG